MKAGLRKTLISVSMSFMALTGVVQSHAQTIATGPSTTQTPYLQPLLNGYKFTSILSANDSIGGYPMVGVPDGLGAYDNGDGTFTLLMNHELLNTQGGTRAHGSKGSFVSKWIIRKSDLTVLSGSDLIQTVKLWNGTGYDTYNASTPSPLTIFQRFCSADLPPVSAFYNSASGKGTQERIFMNGEEVSEGRAMAHIVTGPNAGTSYQLPLQGKMSFENQVANGHASDVTIVGCMDDASITTGNVYFYVGTKTNTGTEIDKAGLTNGKLYGVKVTGFPLERNSSSSYNAVPAAGTHFDLVDLGAVQNYTGAQLDSASTANGATHFSRPEDGAWNPSSLNDFYFNTTDQIDQVNDGVGTQVGRSRLWHLHFTNLEHPELGGTIEAVLDGTEGQNMLDNMTIDKYGHITLLEDVGNSAHNGKIWQYDIKTDSLKMIGKHDPARFGDVGLAATAPFNQDEETSGVIDVQDILGAGWYLIDDQAHYFTGVPTDVVEGGQLFAIYNPDTYRSYITSKGAGPSTSQTPYLLPVDPKVKFTSILSANDSIGGYPMVGVPDGLGAFDNNDGTFTLLMNHELLNTQGGVRAHGSKGSFVSKWIIRKSDLGVISGSDLIQNVKLWNGSGYDTYNSSNPSPLTIFQRFCSADLPAVSAFYNSASGKGTQERIFMNGEEVSEGRAMAHIVTGANAGTSYQLPWFGKLSWENAVANPYSQDKTIVGGMDDASITTGNVYFYVGTKTNAGTEIDKAGLSYGKLYGVKVSGFPLERNSSSSYNNAPAPGTHFDLVDLGDVTSLTGAQLDSASTSNGATHFSRPEDGAWNPSSLNDFYFHTTDQIDQVNDGIGTQVGRSRLWHLHFADITHPEAGGTIEAVLDGTEGQNMLDNLTIDKFGHIIDLEDVGNAAHNGKIWQYDIKTDSLKMIGKHDPARFGDIGLAATSPFNQDEETSGVIDVQSILGPGMYLLDDQAHYFTGIPGDIVEGGQLLAMYSCPVTYSHDTVIACKNYKWNGNIYSTSGTYYYNATNAAGCDSVAILVLTINPLAKPAKPVIAADGATKNLCPSDTVILSTGNFAGYLWSNGATTQTTAINTEGSYSVTVTADNGCTRTSDTVKISYANKCGRPVAIGTTNITTSSASITWNPVTCAVGYILQYRKIGEINFTQVNITNSTTLSYTLSSLEAGKSYEWEVAAVCNNNPLMVSIYSTPKTFRTAKTSFAGYAMADLSEKTLQVSVMPNPASSEAAVFIAGARGNIKIVLSDLNGKILWQNNNAANGKTSIPVEKLSRGTYIITATDGTEKTNIKLVIVK